MKRFKTPYILLSLTFAALIAGCGSKSEATASGGRVLHVGFSQLGEDSDWRKAESDSVRAEAKKRGIDLKFSDGQGKQENQIKALRSFIAQGVDAIVVAPVVETGWEAVLKEAQAKHIPVIFVDHKAKVSDDSLYSTFIGADFVEEGRRAGEKLSQLMGGKGEIAVLAGTPGSTPAQDRESGFEAALAKSPGIKVSYNQSADFDQSKGKEAMEACLKAHGKAITGLFAHNDNMALGAIQAIKEAGLKPGTDIKVASCDAIKACLKAIADGESNVSVECNPILGGIIFDTIQKVLDKKPVEKQIIVPDQVFDSSNAASSLPNRQY